MRKPDPKKKETTVVDTFNKTRVLNCQENKEQRERE